MYEQGGSKNLDFRLNSCNVKIIVSPFGTASAQGSFCSLCCARGLSFFFCQATCFVFLSFTTSYQDAFPLLLGSRGVKSKILLLWSWGDARNGKAEMDPCGRPPETAFRITGTLSFHIFLLFPSHLNSVLLLATCLPQLGFIEVPTAQDKTCSAPAVAIGVPFQADTLD